MMKQKIIFRPLFIKIKYQEYINTDVLLKILIEFLFITPKTKHFTYCS